MTFALGSITMVYYIYAFMYIEPLLHPWDESKLIIVYNLFYDLWQSVCQCLIEDFCINAKKLIKLCCTKPAEVAHTDNPFTWEARAKGLRVCGESRLHSEPWLNLHPQRTRSG